MAVAIGQCLWILYGPMEPKGRETEARVGRGVLMGCIGSALWHPHGAIKLGKLRH